VDIIIISSNVTYSRHDIAEKLLNCQAFNNNHSLTINLTGGCYVDMVING